jgi:hypothetical protein
MPVVFNPPARTPTLYFEGLREVGAASRTLISVAPIEYRKNYFMYVGTPTYVLPVAPPGGYAKTWVFDHQLWLRDLTSVTEDSPGLMRLAHMPVEQVANDFLAHCISGNLGAKDGFHPGVVLCREEEPTATEIEEAYRDHTLYARWCLNDGKRLAFENNFHYITEEHRRQAVWLGADVPWREKEERTERKKCVACGGLILAEALRCEHCHSNLVEFCEQMEITPSEDPVLSRILQARAEKRLAAIPPPPPEPPPLQPEWPDLRSINR